MACAAVRSYAKRAREKKSIPALLVDLYPTIEEVDRIISVESCMLGVEPDGTVFTAKGRNEQIEAKRKQARKTDGLPADGGSVETPEQAETPKDMFDEVIERRNKRKF